MCTDHNPLVKLLQLEFSQEYSLAASFNLLVGVHFSMTHLKNSDNDVVKALSSSVSSLSLDPFDIPSIASGNLFKTDVNLYICPTIFLLSVMIRHFIYGILCLHSLGGSSSITFMVYRIR